MMKIGACQALTLGLMLLASNQSLGVMLQAVDKPITIDGTWVVHSAEQAGTDHQEWIGREVKLFNELAYINMKNDYFYSGTIQFVKQHNGIVRIKIRALSLQTVAQDGIVGTVPHSPLIANGLLRMNGNAMQLCLSLSNIENDAFPSEFSSTNSKHRILLSLRRITRTKAYSERLNEIQGEWSVAEIGALSSTAFQIKRGSMLFRDEQYEYKINNEKEKGVFGIINNSNQQMIKFYRASRGPDRFELCFAVYEINLNRIKMIRSQIGNQRPIDFNVKNGEKHTLLFFQKIP